MTTGTAFLNAIRSAPEDDTARLVYADFLDEEGGPASAARAEFIRVQVRLANLDEADPVRDALEDRENELLRAHERAWLGPLPEALATGLVGWRFERGFVSKVRLDSKTLLDHGEELFDRHPISRVRLTQPESRPPSLTRLAKREWWSRVRELNLSDYGGAVATCEPLLHSPHLTALRRLELSPRENRVPPRTPNVLAGCDWLGGLEELRVNDWHADPAPLVPVLDASNVRTFRLSGATYSADGLRALVSGMYGDRPCRVELADGNLNGQLWGALSGRAVKPVLWRMSFTGSGRNADLQLPTLLSAPAAANLHAIDLGETHQSTTVVRAIVTSGFMSRATELGLIRCTVDAKTMLRLTKPDAPNLRVLKLGETGLRNTGIDALCRASWIDNLTHLDLMRNYLDDDALITMANSGRFVNVRRLDLRVNSPDLADDCKGAITDRGIAALANAPNFARLRHLNLYRARVTARGVETILNGPHWNVCELELGGYDLGPELPEVLAKSPRLARLTKLGLSFTPTLGGDALLPVAESPYLSPLCHLDIRYNNTSDRVRARFAKRLGRRLQDNPAVRSW